MPYENENLNPMADNSDIQSETQNQGENTGDVFEMPQKLQGKSADEIARMYVEAERMAHQASVRASDAARGLESLRGQIQGMQSVLDSRNQPAVPSQPDPFEAVAQEFVSGNEANAFRSLGRAVQSVVGQALNQSRQQTVYQVNQAQLGLVQHQKAKENPQDWAERQQEIAQLAPQYVNMVNPEYLNSPQFLELLDLAAQGRNRQKYEAAAAQRAREKGNVIKQVKNKTFSESGGAIGGHSADASQYGSDDEFATASSDKQKELLEKMRSEIVRQQSLTNPGV